MVEGRVTISESPGDLRYWATKLRGHSQETRASEPGILPRLYGFGCDEPPDEVEALQEDAQIAEGNEGEQHHNQGRSDPSRGPCRLGYPGCHGFLVPLGECVAGSRRRRFRPSQPCGEMPAGQTNHTQWQAQNDTEQYVAVVAPQLLVVRRLKGMDIPGSPKEPFHYQKQDKAKREQRKDRQDDANSGMTPTGLGIVGARITRPNPISRRGFKRWIR